MDSELLRPALHTLYAHANVRLNFYIVFFKRESNEAIKNVKRGRPPKVNQEPKKRGRPQKPKGPTDFREKINDDDQSISSSASSKLSHESNLEVVSDLSEETIKNLLKVEMKSKKI